MRAGILRDSERINGWDSDDVMELSSAKLDVFGTIGKVKASVLILEDHRDSGEMLAYRLRLEGYGVEQASTVAEARALCRSGTFDFVLADVSLPDGDSRDWMPEVRRECGLRGIAVTAHGYPKDIEACLRAGFDGVVVKPYDWKRLEGAIEEIMALPKLSPSHVPWQSGEGGMGEAGRGE